MMLITLILKSKLPWLRKGKYNVIKIIIPIAGSNQVDNETQYIRGLYEIEKKTILQHVYESLSRIKDAEFIVILRKEDVTKFHLDNMVKLMIPNVKIVIADGETKGAACSCLLAIDDISENDPLIIAGSDQLVTVDLQEVVEAFENNDFDGGVITFEGIHPRWSFVRLDEAGRVIEASEKRPISKHATTGFYYFKKGAYFIESAQSMIKKGASVNGKYYVCPVYNEMILKQLYVGIYQIERESYFNFKHDNGLTEYEKYLKEKK